MGHPRCTNAAAAVGSRAAVGLLLGAVFGVCATSCLDGPGFVCAANSECIVNNVQGTCDLSSQTCVYPSGTSCPSRYQDGAGNCVEPGPGVSTTSSSANSTTSETSDSEDSTSSASSDSTTGQDDGSSTTEMNVDGSTSTTGAEVPCGGAIENLTGFGVVGASTVFDGYPPSLSVDGDLATSWFSTGPEGGGAPSVYSWTLASPMCISRIFISGNGLNSNPEFREDYGFETVTFRVLDENDTPQFVTTRELPGTPDEDVRIDVPGVEGAELRLEFSGHESNDCGGFSELRVLGGDPG